MIEIVPSIFTKKNIKGDFFWEIVNNIEPETLYIFNDDNELSYFNFY